MTRPKPIKPPPGGIVHEIGLQVNLLMQLFSDRRVSILLKLIPIAGLLYVINPVDFPGPIDDVVVLIFSLVLFVELCPRAVVEEHRQNLRRVIPGEWHDAPKGSNVAAGSEMRDDEEEDQDVRDKHS
jgi:uncharacterized membrane protein YkvA (DUF1232 family)